ncbi:hypothetical protein [Nostoc sp.]|uniref:hypothetical protein n=1 Tax=Nostoc sp. TaxID=1180 RepID=UPI002FF5C1D6
MQELSREKEELLARITKIVEHLMQKDSSYQLTQRSQLLLLSLVLHFVDAGLS